MLMGNTATNLRFSGTFTAMNALDAELNSKYIKSTK